MQSALFRANIKPPVELVVANLDASSYVLSFDTRMKNFIGTVKPENLRLIEKIQNEQ